MRFHCGISFSWKTIKKILIPILLGALAYFGFNFIYDSNVPLGFIKVNALDNYEHSYYYNYTDLSNYEDYYIDSNNVSFKDLVNTIKNNQSITRDYVITFVISGDSIAYIRLYAFDTNANYTFNIFGSNTSLYYKFTSSNSSYSYHYSITIGNISNIYSNNTYNNFITCITGGTCSSSNANFTSNRTLGNSTTSITDTSDNIFYSDSQIIYYSSKDLIINNTYSTNDIYKSLYVNQLPDYVGDKFITYTDYLSIPTPEPDPDPTPVPVVSIDHKPLFNKIYWFDDNTTELGILSSIYILLFLYCITNMILKILLLVKGNKW